MVTNICKAGQLIMLQTDKNMVYTKQHSVHFKLKFSADYYILTFISKTQN
jgi:hypothetical protein